MSGSCVVSPVDIDVAVLGRKELEALVGDRVGIPGIGELGQDHLISVQGGLQFFLVSTICDDLIVLDGFGFMVGHLSPDQTDNGHGVSTDRQVDQVEQDVDEYGIESDARS